MPLSTSLKNIVWIGVALIMAPFLVFALKEQYGDFLNPQNRIGFLPIKTGFKTSGIILKQLALFFKDPTIRGILLHINCKGGALGSAQLIHHAIEHLKKEYPKPIVTLVENICTAEGYLIACATDSIVAPAGAVIGGVYPSYADYSEVDNHLSNTGDRADILTKITDDATVSLITTVAHKRKISIKEHELWGNGAVFTGSQAVKLHLIDHVGYHADAYRVLKEKALIEGDIQSICPSLKDELFDLIKDTVVKWIS